MEESDDDDVRDSQRAIAMSFIETSDPSFTPLILEDEDDDDDDDDEEVVGPRGGRAPSSQLRLKEELEEEEGSYVRRKTRRRGGRGVCLVDIRIEKADDDVEGDGAEEEEEEEDEEDSADGRRLEDVAEEGRGPASADDCGCGSNVHPSR